MALAWSGRGRQYTVTSSIVVDAVYMSGSIAPLPCVNYLIIPVIVEEQIEDSSE